jgi:hypothetical protein
MAMTLVFSHLMSCTYNCYIFIFLALSNCCQIDCSCKEMTKKYTYKCMYCTLTGTSDVTSKTLKLPYDNNLITKLILKLQCLFFQFLSKMEGV